MEKYQEFIKMYWKWKCMMCGTSFNKYNKYYRLLFTDDEIKKLTKKNLI